mgnify:CR=1 FL=1
MAEHLPQLNASGMAGGSSLWVSCPPDVDAWVLQRLVARRGVLIEPGDIHYLSEQRPLNCFRLGFGAGGAHMLRRRPAALGEAWRELKAPHPSPLPEGEGA